MARAVLAFANPTGLALIGAVALLVAVVVDELFVRLGTITIAIGMAVAFLAVRRRRRARRAKPRRTTIHGPGPIISVIIPGKNEAAYARDCIRSLKHQTLANFEAILIDDGSTDSTLDVVLDEIGNDPRFHVIRTPRSVGIGLARNMGVARANGRYLTFLDLDDFLAPDALVSRIRRAEAHADLPWVAGSYCWHDTVEPDRTPEDWVPRQATPRPTISWLSTFDDAMFIASAPIVRRDVFLAAGGFDASPTSEDQVLWYKLLRWGFVFVSTDVIGIAYRRKPTSHAVATAVAMRDTITRLLAERSEPASPPAGGRGPFFYAADLGTYRWSTGFTRRTASALGIAIASGSPAEDINALLQDLRKVPYALPGWEVDIRKSAKGGVLRVTRARGEHAREEAVFRDIDRMLEPLIEDARRRAGTWLEAGVDPPLPQGASARAVRRPELLPVTPESLHSLVSTGRPFLLLPSSAYHTDELIELVDELRERGFAPLAMLNARRWATTGSALARADVQAVTALPAGDWLLEFAALLTFNDWGEYYQEYVQYVKDKPTVSFAKVEGVQDWLDHDTGRVRNAYLLADIVLCQGDNDVAALQGRRERLEVVGSDRLEAIWTGPLPADTEPKVVGNVNFTYGVQSEHRRLWVETLHEACQQSGVPLTLSLHPSETAKFPELASSQPIRHLLTTDSILVSRFSTVLFEGMARGCSVIYYNPHGEKVPTFHHPEGAFDVADDPETLARHIATAKLRTRAEAKARAALFFERQVSMISGNLVATRTADAIERNLPAT